MSRILLVDDEPLNLELLHARLEPHGYELLDASTGEEALVRAAAWSPDLVLLDVMMPGIGGLETAKRLKQHASERMEFLPVVLVTALNDVASRRRGLEMGADDFLSKPFDAMELDLRVGNLLALRADRLALQQRNQRLIELQRFKDEMCALLVHDLKNPMAVVLSNVEFASDYLPELPSIPTMAEALDDARDGCRRMLRLLANLLDVARAEDSRLEAHRATVALDDVIAPLVQVRQLAAQNRGLRLVTQLAPGAVAPIDADLVGRIIENVLDNALRYTPRGGVISLCTRQVDTHLQVRIGNSGRPIPSEARDALFEKYAQGAPSESKHLNSGLGLYFCRLAAEAHGGRIWIEEEPELPTVFVVSLPSGEALLQ